MPETGTSGLMSGVGKRGGGIRQYPRPASTLPGAELALPPVAFWGCRNFVCPQTAKSLYRGMLYINRICRSTWSPLYSVGSDGNGFDALIAATAASFSAREFDCPL